MHKTLQSPHANIFLAVLLATTATTALGLDYESFEFNDANYSELEYTSNTANPYNQWSRDTNYMVDSYVFNGSFEIRKASTYYAQNYLQIDNIASGTRYMVVEMSGWDIRPTNVLTDPEQVRFGFITEDTGIDGNTIVAEMQITSREVESAPVVQIEGYALGDGSTDLPSAVTINTVQSDPFVMVLELNKTDNSYEVYYKDGSKPSQSLGAGQLAPDRDGNSIRFFVNNNFGEDELGAAPDEYFAINRFAVTDTNPLSDLLTVEVDRDSGEVKLINNTGTALTGLESYSLTSAIGALDSSGWKSITDNFDNATGPGNGSVDPDDDWGIDSYGTSELSESVLAGDGGGLAIGQEVILSTGDGPWIKNPTEDIVAEFLFTGGETRRASVHFVGNGGRPVRGRRPELRRPDHRRRLAAVHGRIGSRSLGIVAGAGLPDGRPELRRREQLRGPRTLQRGLRGRQRPWIVRGDDRRRPGTGLAPAACRRPRADRRAPPPQPLIHRARRVSASISTPSPNPPTIEGVFHVLPIPPNGRL